MITFEELIAPITVKEFKEKYKGKRPFVSKSDKNSFRKKFFSDIISWRKISNYINNNRSVAGIQMIIPDENGSKKICTRADPEYFHDGDKRSWTSDNYYETSKVYEYWKNDSSLILIKGSKLTDNINCIASSIENFYSDNFTDSTSDAHFYCSPNKKSVSFACHADTDDNFLIHSIGKVSWNVYAVWNKDIGKNTLSTEEESDLIPVIEQTLTIGDVLYVPKGLFHKGKPMGPRVSISIPVNEKKGRKLEREYYDFSPIYKPLENENESE